MCCLYRVSKHIATFDECLKSASVNVSTRKRWLNPRPRLDEVIIEIFFFIPERTVTVLIVNLLVFVIFKKGILVLYKFK